ncbi:MAG: response regulator [Nitrospirae bacterium]|nr:response regulator [Nitrospirota bacterium]
MIQSPGKVSAAEEKGPTQTKNILIVDDENHVRQLLSLILKTEGYTVIEAINGRDALNKMNGNDISMVITDLRMPHMDGIEFAKQLKGKPDYRSVPIVMLTSEFQGYKKREGENAGITHWIAKPFIPQQLVRMVKRLEA